jgi:hypothetical protein
MLLEDLFAPKEILNEGAKIAWARVGNKVVKKYRCTDGKRQGRIVSHPSQCNKSVDLQERLKLRQIKAAKRSKNGS